jgi:hypothetical protein
VSGRTYDYMQRFLEYRCDHDAELAQRWVLAAHPDGNATCSDCIVALMESAAEDERERREREITTLRAERDELRTELRELSDELMRLAIRVARAALERSA